MKYQQKTVIEFESVMNPLVQKRTNMETPRSTPQARPIQKSPSSANSPLQQVFEFPQEDSRAECFIPEWSAYAEALFVLNKVVLIVIPFHVVQMTAGRTTVMDIIVDHVVAKVANQSAGQH